MTRPLRSRSKFLLTVLLVVAGYLVYNQLQEDDGGVFDRVRALMGNEPDALEESDVEPSVYAGSIDTPVYNRIRADQVGSVLNEMDIEYEQTIDSHGDPMLRFDLDGRRLTMYFYDCDEGCSSIELYGYLKKAGLTYEELNAWAKQKRFGRVYMDEDGDAVLRDDLRIQGGATLESVRLFIDQYRKTLNNFAEHLGV